LALIVEFQFGLDLLFYIFHVLAVPFVNVTLTF
jgi:hypothetical protein